MMKTTRRIWGAAWNNLFGGVFLFVVFLAYGNLPNRWYHVLYINSGSMVPAIYPGDLIIITPPPAVLKPGMILTLSVNGNLVTHRLVGFGEYGELITQGDANSVVDDWTGAAISVAGRYRARIPYLGYLAVLPGRLAAVVTSGAWFSASEDVPGVISAHHLWSPPGLPVDLDGSSTPTQTDTTPATATPTPTLPPTTDTPPATDPPTPTATLRAQAQAGTSLAAEVTVVGTAPDGAGRYVVLAQVCAANMGEQPTEGLAVSAQVQFEVTDGAYVDLLEASQVVVASEQLAPGASQCYPVQIAFTPMPGAQYRLAARVTITNHAGWLPGGPHCPGPAACAFGPEPRASFELPADPGQPPAAPLATTTASAAPPETATAAPTDPPATDTPTPATDSATPQP